MFGLSWQSEVVCKLPSRTGDIWRYTPHEWRYRTIRLKTKNQGIYQGDFTSRKRISQGWTNHEKSISWRSNADLKPCFEGRSHAEYVVVLPAQQTTGLCTQPLGCPSKSPHASPVSCSSWYKPRQCHDQSRAHDANRTSWYSHFDAGKQYVLGECCCTVISCQVSPNWRGRRMKSDLDCLRQCLSPWRFISAWQTDTFANKELPPRQTKTILYYLKDSLVELLNSIEFKRNKPYRYTFTFCELERSTIFHG